MPKLYPPQPKTYPEICPGPRAVCQRKIPETSLWPPARQRQTPETPGKPKARREYGGLINSLKGVVTVFSTESDYGSKGKKGFIH